MAAAIRTNYREASIRIKAIYGGGGIHGMPAGNGPGFRKRNYILTVNPCYRTGITGPSIKTSFFKINIVRAVLRAGGKITGANKKTGKQRQCKTVKPSSIFIKDL